MNKYNLNKRKMCLKNSLNKSHNRNQNLKSKSHQNAHPQISSLTRPMAASSLTPAQHSPIFPLSTATVAFTSLMSAFQTLATAQAS